MGQKKRSFGAGPTIPVRARVSATVGIRLQNSMKNIANSVIFWLFFASLSTFMAFSLPTDMADAIFVNGDIYTQATPARVQAMAVRDGRIVAVGSNDEIHKLKGAHTQVVDLGGHFVMPGFNDAHCHLQSGGFEQMNVNLVGAKSLA